MYILTLHTCTYTRTGDFTPMYVHICTHVQVTSCDGQWWTGVLNGVTGTFPSNYVQPKQTQGSGSPQGSAQGSVSPVNSNLIPPPSPQPPMTPMTPLSKPAIARVVVAYQSTKQGQLTISYGQLVKVCMYGYGGGSISGTVGQLGGGDLISPLDG